MSETKKKTYSIQRLRFLLGLSQREMANQLGFSNATLAMVESGARKIPDKAFQRYRELQDWLNEAVLIEVKKNEKVELSQPFLREMNEVRAECKHRLFELEQLLERMENTFAIWEARKKLHTQMHEVLPSETLIDTKRMMTLLEVSNELYLLNCSREQQWKVKLEMASLQAQLKVFEEMMMEISG